MTRRERRIRRQRLRLRRIRAAILSALVLGLVVIVSLRAGQAPPEEVTTTPLAAAQTETSYIAPAPAVSVASKPEAVSRYDELEISEDDIYTLACLVYHEARGEPFEGQVAVIEVVLNRMLSPYFPGTVEEVVFQKYGDVWQFSPAPYLWTAEPSETQYEAVHTAIYSTENELPLETVYFSGAPYNDNIVAVIGNHYFCAIEEDNDNE